MTAVEAVLELEQDEPVDIGLSRDEVADLERLHRLKEQYAQLKDEIDYLTEVYCKRLDGVTGRVKAGVLAVTAIRRKPDVTVSDLDGLAKADPELHARITAPAVSRTELRKAMRLGYFAPGTPEEQYLVTTQVRPYLRFSQGGQS